MHKTTCGQDLLSAALNQSGLTDFDIEETNGSNHVLSEKSSVEPLIKFLETDKQASLPVIQSSRAPAKAAKTSIVKVVSTSNLAVGNSAPVKIIKIPSLKAGSIIKINKLGKADVVQAVATNVSKTIENSISENNKTNVLTAPQKIVVSTSHQNGLHQTFNSSAANVPKVHKVVLGDKTVFLPRSTLSEEPAIARNVCRTNNVSANSNKLPVVILKKSVSVPVISESATPAAGLTSKNETNIVRPVVVLPKQPVAERQSPSSNLNLGSLFVNSVVRDPDFDTPPSSPFSIVLPDAAPVACNESKDKTFRASAHVIASSFLHKRVHSPNTSSFEKKTVKAVVGERKQPEKSNNPKEFLRAVSSPVICKVRDTPGKDLVEDEEKEEECEMQQVQTYAEYVPSKLNIGLPHPDSVVESSSLASIAPPDIRYRLSIPQDTIDFGSLSALQLESIVYACQKHSTFYPNGVRAGFFIGDGAGVGKGRTIAGIIYENYLAGRKRALWFSVSNDLKYDAERDLRDIGAKGIKVYALNKFKYGKITARNNGAVKKGVIFATYSSLIGESHDSQAKYHTRLKQLLHWCGDDFDGPIIFDECHKAKNLLPSGSGKSTKTGATVLLLQNQLPKARVVYASATGATEPRNMAYMSRLGLSGPGTAFPDFADFIQAVEKRGVGAMELVAMDMKRRGSYIARQLSFYGVSFRIEEVPLGSSFVQMYNKAVKLWVTAREAFQAAAAMIEAEFHMKKSMWAQFWSAHQRFFKYLCISAKVAHTVTLCREAAKHGKCVVIGLQSTGEAGTVNELEKCGGELDDFVSTAKNVLENLIEKHFPAPDRQRVAAVLGKDFYKFSETENATKKRKRPSSRQMHASAKKPRRGSVSSDDDGSSTSESANEAEIAESLSDQSDDYASDFSGRSAATSDEDIGRIFGFNQSDSEEEESPVKPTGRRNKRRKSSEPDNEPEDPGDSSGLQLEQLKSEFKAKEKAEPRGLLDSLDLVSGTLSSTLPGMGPVERAQALKRELLERVEALGSYLPNNMLDELIDALGGPDNVAEMTGRKGRVVTTEEGNVEYQTRAESDVPVELLNMTEKQRFMNGEKNVAIISEAASSGISLQSDKRARNQRRRVHVTLELPWSADRAIQQFGRTHRSNQVSAPEYVFMITELAGEQRFASVVAKRLESLGALTHGDRRATESRDLSKYNYDNKYGRKALDSIMRAIAGHEAPLVSPPKDYKGDFFSDARQALLGVGLLTRETGQMQYQLDKDYNNIFKFMNRMLGMEVEHQNGIFTFFQDTLQAIVLEAKQMGQFDQGIVDLGAGGDNVEHVKSRDFPTRGDGHVTLHTVKVERGNTWQDALRLHEERAIGDDSGFYITMQKINGKHMAILAIESTSRRHRSRRLFLVYRPNTGKQSRREAFDELNTKYKKVDPNGAEHWWSAQYKASFNQCSHQYWQGTCRRVSCSVGQRHRTYHVLGGSVLSVWRTVERVLSAKEGAQYKMQIVRLKTSNGVKLVGLLIPSPCVTSLLMALSEVSSNTSPENDLSESANNCSLERNGEDPFSDDDDVDDYDDVDEIDPDLMLSSVLVPKHQYI